MSNERKKEEIARLNDILRTTFIGGRVVVTRGVQALDEIAQTQVLRQIRNFPKTGFSPDNDPYGERDFGAVEHSGTKYFWKIDYYDKNLELLSPDPSDPKQTYRVMTVMRADEY